MTILIPDVEKGLMYAVDSNNADLLLIDPELCQSYLAAKGRIIRCDENMLRTGKSIVGGEFQSARDLFLAAAEHPGHLCEKGLDLLRQLGFIVEL